jgi:hypothetical protein
MDLIYDVSCLCISEYHLHPTVIESTAQEKLHLGQKVFLFLLRDLQFLNIESKLLSDKLFKGHQKESRLSIALISMVLSVLFKLLPILFPYSPQEDFKQHIRPLVMGKVDFLGLGFSFRSRN